MEDERRSIAALWKTTEKTTQVVQAGNRDQVIQKLKKLGSTARSETERLRKDEVTLQLIEKIKKAEEEDARNLAEVKKEPIIVE